MPTKPHVSASRFANKLSCTADLRVQWAQLSSVVLQKHLRTIGQIHGSVALNERFCCAADASYQMPNYYIIG